MRAARDERGSGTLLSGLVAVLTILGAGIVLAVSIYVLSVHRVRVAADMAALAGAQTALDAGPAAQEPVACAMATGIARDHGGTVTDCHMIMAGYQGVVTVTVQMPLQWRIPGLPAVVSATAHAGSVA